MRQSTNFRSGVTLLELIVVLVILVILAAIVVPLISNVPDDAKATTTRTTMSHLRDAIIAYHLDMKGIPLPRAIPGTTFTTDSTGIPQTLKDLQVPPASVDATGKPIDFDPIARRGWRGPYLMQAAGSFVFTNPDGSAHLDATFQGYGAAGDVAFLDGWGNPIVLQWPGVGQGSTDINLDLALRVKHVRLVSAAAPTNAGLGVLDTVKLTNGTPPLMPTRPTSSNPGLADQRGNDLLLFIYTQDPYP